MGDPLEEGGEEESLELDPPIQAGEDEAVSSGDHAPNTADQPVTKAWIYKCRGL